MKPKTEVCEDCNASFIPVSNKYYCEICYKKLSKYIDANESVEDKIQDRKFDWS